jgi:hypothetical protein
MIVHLKLVFLLSITIMLIKLNLGIHRGVVQSAYHHLQMTSPVCEMQDIRAQDLEVLLRIYFRGLSYKLQ